MSYILRPRQQEAVDKIINFVNSDSKKNSLFIYPTSFGKSLCVASVANKFPEKHFIVITSGKELLSQNYEKYTSYGYEASLCSASLNSKEVSHVTFSTIGTIVKHVNYFKDKDVVILFDEAHIASKSGNQLDTFIKKIKKVKLLGLTATPFTLSANFSSGGSELKMMNRDRKCIYNSLEDIVQIHECTEQGYWSKLVYDIKDVDTTALELNTTGADYTDESVKQFSKDNDSVKTCIKEIKSLLKEGRKAVLVSVPSIAEAIEIESKFSECKALYSGMDSKCRDTIINDFKSLKLKVVVQVRILTVGFDFQELDSIICMTPSNSLTFWYQYLGRGVRVHKDKKDCKIVDLSGNYEKFGKIEDITIENNKYVNGWAAFSGNRLLTGCPLSKIMPTKKSLKAAYEREQETLRLYREASFNRQVFDAPKSLTITFGKYKDKTIEQVFKENKSYLAWLAGNKEFVWHGKKMGELKKEIFEILKLEYDPPKKVEAEPITYNRNLPVNSKEAINNYVDSIRTIADLKNMF